VAFQRKKPAAIRVSRLCGHFLNVSAHRIERDGVSNVMALDLMPHAAAHLIPHAAAL